MDLGKDNSAFTEYQKRPFHPADPPQGTRNYDPGALEPEQQEALNRRKFIFRQENEAYLHNHPEVRGLTSMIIRHLLEKQPATNVEIQELVKAFFERSRITIATELLEYLLEKKHEGTIVSELRQEIMAARRAERASGVTFR